MIITANSCMRTGQDAKTGWEVDVRKALVGWGRLASLWSHASDGDSVPVQ